MTTEFQQRVALHNAQVELEALRAEGRAMVWANEQRLHAGHSVAYGDDAFNALAARIRDTKVKIDDGVMLAQIR